MADGHVLIVSNGCVGTINPAPTALNLTGPIDMRVDMQHPTWAPSGDWVLAGKDNESASARSWRFMVLSTRRPRFLWFPDGTWANRLFADCTVLLPANDVRRWMRVTFDPDTGSGREVKFFESDDGVTWSQLGDTVTGTATNLFGTDGVGVGATRGVVNPVIDGKFYRYELRDGIDGPLVANPDWRTEAPTADSEGVSWSLLGASGNAIWVEPTAEAAFLRPASDTVTGSWTRNPTNGSLASALAETSETATIDLAEANYPSTSRFALDAGQIPGDGTLRVRLAREGEGSVQFTVSVREGGDGTVGSGTLRGQVQTTRSEDGWHTASVPLTEATTDPLSVEVTANLA